MPYGPDGRAAARSGVQFQRSLPRTLLAVVVVAAVLILILLLG